MDFIFSLNVAEKIAVASPDFGLTANKQTKKITPESGGKNATQHITVLMYSFYFYFCTCASEQQRCSAPEGAYLN